MEQEDNISIDMSLLNIKSPENSDSDVPANSDSENPSATVETDEVFTEMDPVDNGNDGKGSSFEEQCKHVGSEKDHKSDHRIDHSPNDKKVVGSAGAQGHDLAAVRCVPKHGLPKSSNYAVADLKVPPSRSGEHSSRKAKDESKFKKHTFIPMFTQPAADPQFSRIVQEQKVCLKHVLILGATVKGIISVWNLGFQKWIQVFYTTNNWRTRTAVDAKFLSSNSNHSIDLFTFAIYPPIMRIRESLVFCIRYTVNGCEFWDNNNTHDYRLDYVVQFM